MGTAFFLEGIDVRSEVYAGGINGIFLAVTGEHNGIHSIYFTDSKWGGRASIRGSRSLFFYILHKVRVVHPGSAYNTHLYAVHEFSFPVWRLSYKINNAYRQSQASQIHHPPDIKSFSSPISRS